MATLRPFGVAMQSTLAAIAGRSATITRECPLIIVREPWMGIVGLLLLACAALMIFRVRRGNR